MLNLILNCIMQPLVYNKNNSGNSFMYHVDTNNPSSSVFGLKADSGATCHYLKKVRSSYFKNFIKLYHDQKATLPNNSSVQATHSGLLPLGDILSTHTQTHMFFQNYLINSYFLYVFMIFKKSQRRICQCQYCLGSIMY